MKELKNQEPASNVSAILQTRKTKTIKKNLANSKFYLTALMFVLMAVSFTTANANEEERPLKSGIAFYNEVTDFEIQQNDTQDFYIDYLLDEEGKPYIISIKSKDKNMTHMVKKMFSKNNINAVQNNGDWYIVTFLYEHIH